MSGPQNICFASWQRGLGQCNVATQSRVLFISNSGLH